MNLYLRLLLTLLRAPFKGRICMGDVIEMSCRVWPGDLDVNGHMNNGRYLTLLDLAWIEYFVRAGVFTQALKRRWRPMLGGSIITYRRGLAPFGAYRLRVQLVCWDERWNYIDFAFLDQRGRAASGCTKGALFGPRGMVDNFLARRTLGHDPVSPPMPAWIVDWKRTERAMTHSHEHSGVAGLGADVR